MSFGKKARPAAAAPKEILNRRLVAQRISSGALSDAAAVVSSLGAVQAQDYLAALWAIGIRTRDGREQDVEQAIAERRIVRTWPMRGTLHFVAAADARWMTELLAPRAAAAAAGRLRSFGIDEVVLKRARRALVRHFGRERQLTRPAAHRLLEGANLAAGGQRGLHILWRLAQDCLICFGPREGKQQTFVLFDEWLPQARRLPREEALAELAHRYFSAHGPATAPDFSWWSGLKLADARLAIGLAGSRIENETISGEQYWFADLRGSQAPADDRAYALPAFDEFLVGYTDRRAALDAATSRLVIGGGLFKPVLIAGGSLIGTWRRRIARQEVMCSVEPFRKLTRATIEASTRAFQRYAHFVGLPLRR